MNFKDNQLNEINNQLRESKLNRTICLDGILLDKGQLNEIINTDIYDSHDRITLSFYASKKGGNIELLSIYQSAHNIIDSDEPQFTDYIKNNKNDSIILTRNFKPEGDCINTLSKYLINSQNKEISLFIIPLEFQNQIFKYSFKYLNNKSGKKTDFIKINEKVFDLEGNIVSDFFSPVISIEEFMSKNDKDRTYFMTTKNFVNKYKYYCPTEKESKKLENLLEKREKKFN